MEDRHVSIEDLNALFGITTSPCLVGYYAIFDGHHGHEAAAYSAAQLHCLLVHSKHYPHDPEAALKDAFFRADEVFIKKCASSKFLSGTTALVALVRHQESLHVAWLGDSLGILVRKGGKVTQFVNPHTAERQDERDRILSTGGAVFQHFGVWRINGTLAISRAIGDPDCKPHVSAVADVVSYPLDGSEHFMILACDGLWDCVTETQASAFVYDHLRKEPENHADLSKLLVNLAKSRASNDNISVVVVLLSPVEDILASAPPPASPEAAAREEDLCAAEAPTADGLAPEGAPCLSLVNGAAIMDTATTAAADTSLNPFAPSSAPFKGSPTAGPPDNGLTTSPLPGGDRDNHLHDNGDDHHNHSAHQDDEDGLVMDYHHHRHNGHGDIMTSSFYGNGGANGEDARHLFGDPTDLGPETDVDLLDDDGMIVDVGQAAEEEYKARALEFGVEDGLVRQEDLLGGGVDYRPLAEGRKEDRVLQIEDRPVPYNPFAVHGDEDDWMRGGKPEEEQEVVSIEIADGGATEGGEGGVVGAAMEFGEEPSTRQHCSDVSDRQQDGDHHQHLLSTAEEEGEEVIQIEEAPVVVKGEVVPEEDGIEVGGGSGLEEADDDSEEEGEWKYVSAKPGEGGAVVPEAISPEAALPDETSCSPALPDQDLIQDQSAVSPALPPRLEAVTPEVGEAEDFLTKAEDFCSKAEGFHTEAEDFRFKAEEFHTEAEGFHTEAEDFLSKAEDFHAEAESFHTKAEDFCSKAEDFHTKAEDFHTEAEDFHTEAEDFHTEAEDFHTKAEDFHTEAEDFHTEAEETHDHKAEELVADDDKFCLDLGFEVVQKTHVEEVVCEAGLLDKPVEEGREPQAELPQEEGSLREAKSPQQIEGESEDSMMESRLNPDAAEFVPVSPTSVVNTESFSGFNNDFDAFKKEAEACPGEVSGEAVASTTRSLVSRGIEDDVEAVLSSSFSHDVPKPSDMFQDELIPHALDTLTSPNEFHDEDENKENICQEEDKENISQLVTTSDVDSTLNRSFEVLEEQVIPKDKASDSFGSPLDFSRAENQDEMASEPSGQDLMSDLVSESIASEAKLQDLQKSLELSSEMTFEISTPIQNVSEAPIEPTHSTQLGEININQFGDFMHPSSEEDHIQHHEVLVDGERSTPKDDNVQQIKESLKMELSPEFENPLTSEVDEQIEMLDHQEKIKETLEMLPHSPVLQICPMKAEVHNLSELSSELKFVEEDLSVNKELMMDFGEDSNEIKPTTPEPEVKSAEPLMERFEALEAEVAEFTTESIFKSVQEVEPVEPVSVLPPLDSVCMSPTFPTTTSELSSIIEGSQALSLEEKVPAVEEQIQKMEEISESFNLASEMVIVQETTTQNLEDNVCMASSDKISSPEAVEIVDFTKEIKTEISLVDVTSSEPLVEAHPKEVIEESIPEDISKAATVVGAAAAVAAVAGVATAAAVTSASSDAKPPAKKPIAADKKQVPDKSKVSSSATAKAKSSPKPPVTAARTMAPKKAAAPPTNKTAPTPAARTATAERKPTASTATAERKPAASTATAERKPAASTAKPAATSKPTTTTLLSSKPRTTVGAKPATAPTRVGAAPKASAPSRPFTATSTASKSGVTSAKSASSSRPSTAPPKTTEPKKMLNGDSSKPTPASLAPSKTSPRKSMTAGSTTASKPLGSARPLASARGAATPAKTATETAAAKAKQSSVTGALNGAVPKTTRTTLGAGAKPSAPAPSRTKATTPAKSPAPSAPGNAKKAKESVNKHISATRLSGVTATSQKSADGKTTGSLATKTSTLKSPATKTMANGTAIKRPAVNLNSQKVEEKVELLISPHENGIALDCNEMRKELGGVVGMEDGVHEVKEQMVLIGDALSIGEAV